MAPQDAQHKARLLEAAGYRYDPETDSWKNENTSRALAGAMAATLSERDLRAWIAAARGRGRV